MVKKVLLLSCPLLAILLIAGSVGCSARSTITSTPQPTSESRSTGGFSFTVTVSNTHPHIGDNIVITTELQNISNTGITVQQLGGQITIQLINSAGQVVWGKGDVRSGTTLTAPAGIGWHIDFTATCLAGNNTGFTTPVNVGTYTITASDSATSLSVTPIQIVVTG